ncbi:hypothetical protein, partial [Burkholderia gladioli]|uniref:hypothetical protein n=1 Tax=Burkholderia gladioli TaxID=28095 RepID=UPI0034DB5DFD
EPVPDADAALRQPPQLGALADRDREPCGKPRRDHRWRKQGPGRDEPGPAVRYRRTSCRSGLNVDAAQRLERGKSGIHQLRMQLDRPDQKLNILVFAFRSKVIEFGPHLLYPFGAHGDSFGVCMDDVVRQAGTPSTPYEQHRHGPALRADLDQGGATSRYRSTFGSGFERTVSRPEARAVVIGPGRRTLYVSVQTTRLYDPMLSNKPVPVNRRSLRVRSPAEWMGVCHDQSGDFR